MRLPYVPAPYPGEWIGFWLHRIASTYGIDLPHLLRNSLSIEVPARMPPTWGRIQPLNQSSIKRLSEQLEMPQSRLWEMQQPISTRAWLAQVGFCSQCLDDDDHSEQVRHWRLHWLDPYQNWCEMHRCRLKAVDAAKIRCLTTTAQTNRLMESLSDRDSCHSNIRQHAGDAEDVDSIIMLQTALRTEANRATRSIARPLLHLVNVVVWYATEYADQLNSDIGDGSVPNKAQLTMTFDRSGVEYLGKIRFLDQRAAAHRFAAAVLLPTNDDYRWREAFWPVLSESQRDRFALSFRRVNAGGTKLKWDVAQAHAKHVVRRIKRSTPSRTKSSHYWLYV